jgi:AcrR family transcriptional regulator
VDDLLEQNPEDWRSYPTLELTPILRGAVEAFREHGYHGTSVRDIASRVGLTVPALYYHHGNKEGILVALLNGSVQGLAMRARAAVTAAGDDPTEQFKNFVECIVLFMAQRSPLAGLDAEIRALSPENRKAYAKTRKQVEDLCLEIVRSGVEAGVFVVPHPEDTTRALLGMLQAISTWYDPEGILSPAEIADRYKEICLQTVGAKVPAPKPTRARKQSARS